MKSFLIELLGRENVLDDPKFLAPYQEDFTEIAPTKPSLVALPSRVEEIQKIVVKAGELRLPITPCVYRTNVGGLTLASPGGLILDLSRMNRIHEVHVDDMYAVIEPGVTQRQIKDYLVDRKIPLTLGFSLAPPKTSIFANALLGGLTNRSLKYGDQSQSISALEVVLGDGSLMRTGSWAHSEISPFGRVPFPDLTGLFVGWQGSTGIATKMAFQLWPKHPLNKRLFILAYSTRGAFGAMQRLCRKEVCDDVGGLSWPTAKMLLGVKRPDPIPDPAEPTFFLYVDLTAEIEEEMQAKESVLNSTLEELRRVGERFEAPIDIKTLLSINPAMGSFAEFPTELDFLTNHGGGGLTWIGTYGPLSRFVDAADEGIAIMTRHGVAPTIVSRPMRGGHYGVLRFVSIFDKKDSKEVAKVTAMNLELLQMATRRGLLMYKTPAWAWKMLKEKIDPGMIEMMRRIKSLLDPQGILNPGKLC